VSRSRITHILDGLALVLVLAALAIALTGGFVLRIAGTKITARSAERPAVAAVLLVAARIAIDRRTRPLSGVGGLAARARDRLYDPAHDRVVALPAGATWRRRALASAGLSAFGAVLLLPQLRRLDSVPDLGDPLFSIWRIGWVFHKLTGDPRPLFSPNVFYPHELTLTYSDSMLLPALTTTPFLAAGMHPVVAYNIVMALSFVVSAIAMYVLAEELTGSPPAAFVSALLFGFHPYRFEHYSHFELQMTYCMPLALLALQRFTATARLKHAVLAGLLAAGQLYCSMYYSVFFMLFAGVVFAMTCWLTRAPLRRLAGPAAVAAALALLLAWPLAHTYRAAHLGDRDAQTVEFYSATPADYLRAHPRSATWGERTLSGRQPERALFPGVMLLLLAGVALVPPIGVTRAIYAAGLVAIFEISRGFHGPVYPYLYDWLPFIRGLRVPARASILVGLALAVLAGFGVRRLLAGRSPAAARLALAAIVLAIGVDLRPILRLEPVWSEPPAIYGAVAGSDAVLAEFPFGGNPAAFTSNVPFMYFSLWHWANLINGYSGHYPEGQVELEVALKPFPAPPTIDLLRERGATHVSVNCALYRWGCEALLDEVDRRPELRLVTSTRWQGQPVRLYELRR
jgi:hypothetical protein